MKKTVRTLSLTLMAIAMAICFFFAGLAFVKADGELVDVDLTVYPGARVLVAGDAEETGIQFIMKLSKADYASLVNVDENTKREIHLGVQVGNKNADGEFVAKKSNNQFTVKTTETFANFEVGGEADSDYYMYAFSVTYNLDRIFAGQNFTDQQKATYVNKMYLDELCVRPFYAIVSETDPIVYWYGEAGEARSMLHVAVAELADENSTIADKEAFAAKYINGGIQDGGAISIYADGSIDGLDDAASLTYTVGTSGKVVMEKTETGIEIDEAFLATLKTGVDYEVYGYTADRVVTKYTAQFKAPAATTAQAESVVINKEGKLFLNSTSFANREVGMIFYDDQTFSADVVTDANLGKEIEIVAKVGGEWFTFNALYVTEAYENTRESRLAMRDLFSAGGRTHNNSAGSKAEKVTGYYVLLENITFDFSNVPATVETANSDTAEASTPYEFFNNVSNTSNRYNTFTGTFDGRGYSLDNVYVLGASSSMFGFSGDGATIKNVAILGINVATRNGSATDGFYYNLAAGAGTTGKIFHSSTATTDKVTFENVYINDQNTADNGSYGGLFYYVAPVDAEGVESLPEMSFKNVIIVNSNGPLFGGKTYTAVKNTDSILDTYYVSTRNVAWGTALPTANTRGENFVKCSALPTDADYKTFSSDYWTIVDKVPVWNTVSTVAYVDGAVVSEINSTTAGETFDVVVKENGIDVTASATIAIEGDVATLKGNQIVIGANKSGTATVTVTYKEETLATYTVIVDTVFTVTLTKGGVAVETNTINETNAGAEYVIAVTGGGLDSIAFTVESDNDAVVATATGFTIASNAIGTANVTVKYGETTLATYVVTVDTREAQTDETALILSKVDGKLYYADTLAEYGAESLTYNGTELVKDGKINASVVTEENGEVIKLFGASADGLFNLTNVKAYAGAFKNTKESRCAMLEEFSGADRISTNHSEYCSAKTLTGTYILLESITFDLSNIPVDATAGAMGFDATGATHEFFNNTGSSRKNTFKATLDGMGYSINNANILGVSSSMFGFAGDGATIKNIAFNHINVYTASAVQGEGDGAYRYYTAGGISNGAKFFYQVDTADASVTFENVYINDDNASDNNTYGALFFYSAIDNGDSTYGTGNLTFKNVIIENAKGPVVNGSTSRYTAVKDTDVVLDTYVITSSSIARGAATTTANTRDENFVKYSTLADMKAATANDYTSFSKDYWTIVDKVPVWNDFVVVGWLKDSEGTEIEGDAIDAVGSYTYTAGMVTRTGTPVPSTVSVTEITAGYEDNVTTSGNTITVNASGVFSATITVTDGTNSASFVINVDARVVVPCADTVLLSKLDGKLYFNESVTLDGEEYTSVVYNGNELLSAEGVINTDGFTVNSATPYTLLISTADSKYSLSNVMVYDGVFENTPESRKAFVTTLNKYTGTLEGYYVLAESLTFDYTSTADRAASPSATTFNATFDGRGYTLNNLNLPASNFFGFFGTLPGTNAVLKNFAINRIYTNGVEDCNVYQSVLFGGSGAVAGSNNVDIENVYIYRKIASNSNNGYILYYTNAGSAIDFNLNNVVVEIEYDSSYSGNKATSFAKAAATGSATNTYLLINGTNSTLATKIATIKGYGAAADTTLDNARDAMRSANNDYASFTGNDGENCWAIANGIPVWKSCASYAEVKSGEEVVYSISEPGQYSVSAFANDASVTPTVTADNANVTYSAGVITVAGGYYTATITVAYGEKILATIPVAIDTRTATEITEEVLISKADSKLYLQSAPSVAALSIKDITYDGESVYTDGTITVANIDEKVNSQFALRAEDADGNLYDLTNVKIYDNVFVNTRESRKAMVDLFSAGDRTTDGTSSAFSASTVTGYYVLAENITFSAYAEDGVTVTADEAFSNIAAAGRRNIFSGTFDGRGYTMNNLLLYSNCQGGMFGLAADGATVKNVAINGIGKVSGKASSGYTFGKTGSYTTFFISTESVDTRVYFENIYMYRDISSSTGYNTVFFYEGHNVGTTYEEYVVDETTTVMVEKNAYDFGKISFNNVIVDNGTSKSPLFGGLNGNYLQVEYNEETGAYEYVDGDETKDDVQTVVIETRSQMETVTDNISVTNFYGISAGNLCRDAKTKTPAANTRGETFNMYANVGEMIAANNDYSSFEATTYWTVAEGGIPVWATLPAAE